MPNKETHPLRKIEGQMHFNFSSQIFESHVSKTKQVDKDSGVYESYSCSQRGSVCSSGCPAVSPDTTSSSAYSSAISTCSEHDHYRQKLACPTSHVTNRVPFHPKLSGASPFASHLCVSTSTTSRTSLISQWRNPVSRSTSMKSDRSSSDISRCLCDRERGKVYEKKRLLGKGGFARVYEVSEVGQWSRPMAAKVIDKSRVKRSSQREKVNAEIELFAEASGHPNVVSYYDTFEDENCICILQELCSQKSLAQYLRRKQSLSEVEVCDVMRQIISGLKHLHSKGIIHRDLKLGNILLTDDLKVKIGDFGLATRVEAGQKKTVCGTPNFIAPEVLQRQGHGLESDIWALGCLLYTMLVGKPPFETACLRDTYRCILKNNYRIPVTVSNEAADLIQSTLRLKPCDRLTLSEIASHPFFEKHLKPSKSKSLSTVNQCDSDKLISQTRQNETDSSSQSDEEKSVIQRGETSIKKISTKAAAVDEVIKSTAQTKNSGGKTKRPVKSFATILQKKLTKLSCPKKQLVEQAENQSNSNEKKTSETWVTKWVDYSNRYGFGYQLSTGTVCVLFNDGKHISINPCTKIIEYAASEKATALRFESNAIPHCLTKYASVLMSFSSYIGKSFQPCNDRTRDQVINEARLLAWCRTDKYVAMYFNNGTMQVNFNSDHVKVGISSLHNRAAMRFTVVDQYQRSKVYNRNEFLACADATMLSRVSAVHRQFHGFFDVKCGSHPFCEFCWEHSC